MEEGVTDDYSREHVWTLDNGRQLVHGVVVVPLPSEYNLFILLEIAQRENCEPKRCSLVLVVFLVFVVLVAVATGWTYSGPYNGVRAAAVSREARLASNDASVEGNIERGAKEMHKWLGHAEAGVGVERVGEVGGGGGYGRDVLLDESGGRDGVEYTQAI
jgi:hypothetical protein